MIPGNLLTGKPKMVVVIGIYKHGRGNPRGATVGMTDGNRGTNRQQRGLPTILKQASMGKYFLSKESMSFMCKVERPRESHG